MCVLEFKPWYMNEHVNTWFLLHGFPINLGHTVIYALMSFQCVPYRIYMYIFEPFILCLLLNVLISYLQIFYFIFTGAPSIAQSSLHGGQVGADGLMDGQNAAAGSGANVQAGLMQVASNLGGWPQWSAQCGHRWA